jgi:hypothetical protein
VRAIATGSLVAGFCSRPCVPQQCRLLSSVMCSANAHLTRPCYKARSHAQGLAGFESSSCYHCTAPSGKEMEITPFVPFAIRGYTTTSLPAPTAGLQQDMQTRRSQAASTALPTGHRACCRPHSCTRRVRSPDRLRVAALNVKHAAVGVNLRRRVADGRKRFDFMLTVHKLHDVRARLVGDHLKRQDPKRVFNLDTNLLNACACMSKLST